MNFLNLKADDRTRDERLREDRLKEGLENLTPTFRIFPGTETSSSADKEMIAFLKNEVGELRSALRDAERKLHQYEQLIKNSRHRERDLRSQLGNRS